MRQSGGGLLRNTSLQESKDLHLHYHPSAVLNRSVVSDCVTPGTVARQAPLSIGFSRQEYWSG